MDDDWPFTEARNAAVFTTKRVIYRRYPVLQVVHREDGTWHFLDGRPVNREDAALVTLEYIVSIDPGLRELADLPSGWQASRPSSDRPWQRTKPDNL